ncbi:hypothetical protein B566_EDAN015314, partial [Ephemera danica]
MLSLDAGTVCKPLVARELRFYQTLPDAVRRFSPAFYGIIQGGDAGIFEDSEFREQQEAKCKASGMGRRISATHNPWSLRYFILLENLTSRFSLPCVLDLKMGTRQYSDLATAAKRHSKMLKVANTTSGQLTVSGFERSLYQFLHNGNKIRADILPPLIRKLQELYSILEQQEAFRFYTSSLLLVYDGDISVSRRNSENKLNAECEIGTRTVDVLGRSASCDAMSYVTSRRSFERSHSLEPTNCDDGKPEVIEPLVDVRIIDFAHSTHKSLGDPIQYTGPDQGFLFGIEN